MYETLLNAVHWLHDQKMLLTFMAGWILLSGGVIGAAGWVRGTFKSLLIVGGLKLISSAYFMQFRSLAQMVVAGIVLLLCVYFTAHFYFTSDSREKIDSITFMLLSLALTGIASFIGWLFNVNWRL